MKIRAHVKPYDWTSSPWKNGGGTTVQLTIDPEQSIFGEETFNWRISLATASASGSFSRFTGFDRVLTIISGGIFELGHGESTRLRALKPFKPHSFPGERAPRFVIKGEPVRDINVMVRREWGGAKMTAYPLKSGEKIEVITEAQYTNIFCVELAVALTFGDSTSAVPLHLNKNDFISLKSEDADSNSNSQILAPKKSKYLISGLDGESQVVIVEVFKAAAKSGQS